ncbi:ubiquitin carboxyl-terminal hydrolase 32-like isoform X2 [Mizuhopecten yessoensis]|uniref:ubiquitin carboxyl-terminal hydrolase 32-like isoform X2 n=1 Tax=Mizuhopecten yessoensis TaxID=6573 RepID=UPI000B458337|nr:ubiquitin carboxyl-terminal hydrolase 32-like isoform X2 [Mizuhopecten yessoensis]
MGGKESKLSYIPYEDVMKRIRDNEMKRLKDAFKRVSSFGGMMTETMFTREVLGDGVPDNISQLLYKGFGGTSKGVSFKDLLTGLIIITKGSKEDKIKLIFGMYADESYTYVQKDDMDRRILETEGQVSTALSDLFLESDQVGFEQFRSWLYHHPDATIITKWLLMEPMTISLSNDTDTPTFYQTLAGVTHLEESDISELDKRYWVLKSQSKSGKFDVETFKALVCPPVPESVCEGLFKAFDENRDNHIDFKEMACGISACCRGPSTERQKFCFKVFDANHDNKLNHAELKSMLNALLLIRFESRSGAELESDMFHKMDPHSVASEILACHDTDKGLKDTYVSKRDNEEQDKHQDGCISMAEYLVWTVNNTLADDFLDLLSQVGIYTTNKYLVWTVNNTLADDFLDLLSQVGIYTTNKYLVWTVNNTLADDFLDLLSQVGIYTTNKYLVWTVNNTLADDFLDLLSQVGIYTTNKYLVWTVNNTLADDFLDLLSQVGIYTTNKYLVWTVNNTLADDFLDLLSQVGIYTTNKYLVWTVNNTLADDFLDLLSQVGIYTTNKYLVWTVNNTLADDFLDLLSQVGIYTTNKYLVWTVNNTLADDFLDLLSQVGIYTTNKYLVWTVNNTLADDFLDLLSQVGIYTTNKYLVWTVNNTLADDFLDLLSQVGIYTTNKYLVWTVNNTLADDFLDLLSQVGIYTTNKYLVWTVNNTLADDFLDLLSQVGIYTTNKYLVWTVNNTLADDFLDLLSQVGIYTTNKYLVWTVNNTLADDFLDLLSQICHIVLGLKPQKREEEGKIVNDWLSRESRKPFRVGQVWYLLAMQWWNSWIEYVSPTAVEANVLLDQNGIEKGSFLDSPVHHRITKGKHQSKTLPWDDDSVIVVNVTKGTNSELGGATNQVRNHTLPRASNHSSVYSSPLRHCLNPGESTVVNRSPSPSPKLRKKNVHSCNSVPPRPGAIDNSQLIALNTTKVSSLTNEGGRLKRDTMLVRGKDFELVPEPVWRALSVWYGTDTPLPRTVIASANNDGIPELELYPVTVRLQRHQMPSQRPAHMTTFTGMMSGIGAMTNFVANSPQTPRRFVAYSATFSQQHTLQQVYEFLCTKLRLNREDMRLWKIGQKEDNMTLLDDENTLIEECALEENQLVLIEIRNKDLTWPEEMSQLAKNKTFRKDQAPTHKGATGLNNLGNTCFMNAAVQCVSNTWPLTHYFIGGLHLFELNRTNPLGMKGHIAQRYGDLVKDLWSGTAKSIAPLKLRWTIGKYAPRFNGFQQHDSQELLSFLLDGLHEDLNRVHDKPYVELKDSDGRPDNTVAEEAWENHLKRNQSIIVDFFHGQLKSEVRCQECSHASVRFDPFNYLSLPLPMESCIHLEVIVMRLEGTVPKKYGLRLNMDEKYRALKRELSKLTNIPFEQILFVEIMGPLVKTLPKDDQKLRTLLGGVLYAYELPPPEDIKPLTVEEEKCSKTKSSLGLNDIQRGLTKAKVQAKLTNGNVPSMSLSTSSDIGSLSTGNTPSHSRNPSDAGMMGSLNGTPENNNSMARSIGDHLFKGFVISVHRKMNLMDVYFLSSQKTRPCLFGTPIILPCSEKTNNLDLYQFVWTQVSRLVSPLPPSEAKSANHAQDCDDSLGYEYPFTLKVVQKDGLTCAWCPWYRFCRGCRLECTADPFNFGSSFIAIDWEPTALHLRYQTSHEKLWEEHSSVEESRRRQTEPIDLDTCLQAFTKEEELGEEELYYCSKCKKHCLAIKKLDIWRLPPILIINLKRFQFLNGKWVKSHKIVKFPIEDFDPSNYIAPTRKAHNKSQNSTTTTSTSISSDESLSQSNHCCQNINTTTHPNPVPNERMWGSVSSGISSDESGSVMDTSDYSQMNGDSRTGDSSESSSLSKPCQLCAANRGNDYSNVKYNLYAMSCHTGILGGGHYVGYAKNPNKKWYCYNDSSCKEIPVGSLDTNSAYILFYEQQGLDFAKFMPDLTGKEPDLQEIEDEFESDFKKMCVLQ